MPYIRPQYRYLVLLALLAGCGGGDTPPLPDRYAALATAVSTPRCPAPPETLQTISTIQGSGRRAPLPGQRVTLRGVVTGNFQKAKQLHGFFMQQSSRSTEAHSKGIFIYLPAKAQQLESGQYVQVTGAIDPLKTNSDQNTTLNRINSVSELTVCGTGATVTPRTLTLPARRIQDLDAVEGMLVTLPQTLTVTDNHALGYSGELLLSATSRLYHPNNNPDAVDPAQIADENLRAQLILDDGTVSTHPNPIPYLSAGDSTGTRRSGDTTRALTGIVTRAFGVWRLEPVIPPSFAPTNPRPLAPADVGGTVRVASMNVLSYFTTLNARGAKSSEDLQRQRDKLVSAISALDADIIGLMEIENGSAALTDLVSALNAQSGAQTYSSIDNGSQGTDVIKVAMIYRPGKVTPVGNFELPSRPRPGSYEIKRPSLAQRFAVNASQNTLWVVAAHLKSKSRCMAGRDGADQDNGQGCWNATRVRQASALERWVATLRVTSGEDKVLLIGDFNAYPAEDPVRVLTDTYEDLVLRLEPAERYSYLFAGQSGVLDHGFASQALRPRIRGITLWHINADEPAVLDYSSATKPDDRFAVSPFRSSDHDPLLIGLDL